jgi:hypothetical protein
MQLCGYRVKLASEPGFLDPVSEAMCYGTLQHHIISEDIRVGEVRLDLLTSMDEWVEKILVEDYDWSLSQVPNPRELFSDLSAAYRQWRRDVQPKLGTPIAVEQELYMYLAEGTKGNLWIKGTPDAVYERAITDWKTAGRGWKETKAHLSIQASTYMALVKQNLDVAIRKFHFWVYDRAKKEWTLIRTERTVGEVNAALITAEDYARILEAGLYVATPVPDASFVKARGWYCKPKFCGAWNICPAKYLNDDVNEKEIAERKW